MQKKISRKSAAALGAGLMSMSLTGFAGLLMLAPGAQANEEPANPDDGSAAVTAAVTTEEICGWNLLGAPGSITLIPETDGAEYVGEEFPLIANFTNKTVGNENTLNLYVSGTDQDPRSRTESTACTWYASSGLAPAAATVKMAFTGSFASAASRGGDPVLVGDNPDTSLSFTPGQSTGLRGSVTAAPLLVTPTAADATACEAAEAGKKFAVSDVSLSAAATPSTLMTMLVGDVAETAAEDEGQRCDLGFQVKVTVPQEQLPANPGAIYNWAGVSLLTTITTATSNPAQ
jgi:hypothetical protein